MALLDLAGVKEAFVSVQRDESGEASLVAYLVPAGGSPPTGSGLRAAIGSRLPAYMLSRAFVLVDALPRILNGKVDRQALPAPPRRRPALGNRFVAPRNALEALIAEVWEEALEIQGSAWPTPTSSSAATRCWPWRSCRASATRSISNR